MQFDFTSGALCLDFVNTMGDRQRPSTEQLHTCSDLVAWGRQSGALARRDVSRLERRAHRSSRHAAAVLARAIEIREALYRLFSTLAAGDAPAPGDVAVLNANLARTLPDLQLAWRRNRFDWQWRARDRLDGMLRPVLRSAAELLTSSEAMHVRECASPACSWMFIDRSRTHRRRWCSMQTCGNRNKARRHYERIKQLNAPSRSAARSLPGAPPPR
jgi:predicted RNA-binding Zn ribbon-like protein